MHRDTPARCDRRIGGSRRRFILELLTRIRGGTRIAVAVGLLGCFGSQGLWASTSPEPGGLTVHRSTRAVPHRFTVHPEGATVPANQTQLLEVSDAQGRPVAVRWNVSGIGCFGAACGTIDKQGVYRTPSSLPQPRVVILEAVVVADPNYSVLTQVRLEDTATAPVSPPSAQVAAGKTQQFTAPVVGRQNVVRSPELPLQSAVAAAPVVGRQSIAHNAELPPLPSAVAAAPEVGRQSVAHNAELPALPSAVDAAPVVGKQSVAHNAELPPLPNAVAAAPAVGQRNVVRSTELPPLPNAVAAAPAVGQQNVVRSTELPSLPNAVAAAPAVGRQSVARSAELPSLPGAVAARPVVGRQNVARSAVLPQLSDEGAAARVDTVVGTARSPVVTYQNGQLTIDAETLTLAEVLKLIAEKTGAEIDVPSGSGLDRIIEHAGPGRAENVLASLLNGSPFDFVIVSSPQPPHDPTQVLLFLHRKDTPAIDQTVNASAKPTTPSSPVLFKPPSTSVLFTPPADASSASVVAPPPLVMGPPAEPIPPEVREQMMRDFSRQLRGQPPQ